MSKELPYFKFEPNQWENGNIQMCTREGKGLFIDLCSMYWSRLGDLPIKLAVQKLCAGNATALDSLISDNIFTVIDSMICIDFLNEQLGEFEHTSSQNSKNAREGWEKRRKKHIISDRNATALNPQREIDAIREEKIREEKIREEKIKEEGLIFPFDSIEFKETWKMWKEYKKDEHKFNYKSIISEQAALKSLSNDSNCDEQMAIKIIMQSIENGWKGFFKIQNNGKQKGYNKIRPEQFSSFINKER
jgi:hypothetical protein